MLWRFRGRSVELHRPPLAAAIMGILNITPDSFSDGGLLTGTDDAVARYLELVGRGCAVIDIGGQSTRPGHTAISADEEWARIEPTLTRLAAMRREGRELPPVSVDTYYPQVAARALESGADIINDVTGLCDPAMRRVIAGFNAGCVLMHCADITGCGDPVNAVWEFFLRRADECINDGIAPESICLDCGIGFGKTREQEVTLLERMGECRVHGLPLLAAASRKRVIAHIMGVDVPPDCRDQATHRAHLIAVRSGADIVRVHDAEGAYRSLLIQ